MFNRKFLPTFLFLMITWISVHTQVDSVFQCTPEQSVLLDSLQYQTIQYFWKGGEPVSGAARERLHLDEEYPVHPEFIITSGGTGFGIMALIVGIERGFIPRSKGVARLQMLADWLGEAQRYHGAWSHWYYPDGYTFPFSKYDDGGDIVETAFLAQGLITARQYFRQGNEEEKALADQLDSLWRGIEWDWYTKGEDVLYWHWSSYYDFKMNFRIRGHNECLIAYVMAASSPDHGIDRSVLEKGYFKDGAVFTDASYYDLPLILDHYDTENDPAGPLFWAHYSHLGLDPRGLRWGKADFWEANRNHALIHYRHCVANPYAYRGYGPDCWGLTSSYSMQGYAGHHPTHDLGVIAPTAALSSFPYTPRESMQFLEFLYGEARGLTGEYGPYDAFSFQSNWILPRYLAIDQLPIPVMVENYRTGLLWKLFMSAPEIEMGLEKLGFEYRKVN